MNTQLTANRRKVLFGATTVPIQALSAGAERIGSGDLNQRINIKTGDEIEALANQFNDMAGKLQDSYTGLQQKVEERTHELNESNRRLHELNESLEQRVVAETRDRLQIWNVSQDLLVVTDLKGACLGVNPAWTATLGWTESDLVGRSYEGLTHPDDRDRARAKITHLVAGGKSVRFESRLRRKDGSYRLISWNAAPDQARIYATGRDITELRDAENELGKTRRELAQTARRTTVAAMSAAIAHEIKQPLAAIMINAAAGLRWLNGASPDLNEARRSFKNITTNGDRANGVIESVRAIFSKNEQPGTSLDINELIHETIALLRSDLEMAGVVVRLDLAQQLPLVLAHRGQLQQVILNVVTNALDAMRTVTDRARVLTVKSALSETNGVTFAVEDSGMGIESSNLDRVFETFFTTKASGMGMGLAICRSIVEGHGGRLWTTHGADHGAIFHVELPGHHPPL
jgi:PAS domain S-box-containing protein